MTPLAVFRYFIPGGRCRCLRSSGSFIFEAAVDEVVDEASETGASASGLDLRKNGQQLIRRILKKLLLVICQSEGSCEGVEGKGAFF